MVDVGLPDSENKLYKEGITATGNPDVTYPDGTTSDSEERAVTELLYQYFEENKQTVPDLENVTVDDLTVEAVLDRFESSQEGDGNSWTPTINATVNRYYTLRLVYNPEADSNNPDEKQIVNAVNLVNVSWNVGMGLTPAFTATVDEADQDRTRRIRTNTRFIWSSGSAATARVSPARSLSTARYRKMRKSRLLKRA